VSSRFARVEGPEDIDLNIIELARSGRRIEDLAAEFKLSPQTVRNWIKQAELNAGRRSDGLTAVNNTEAIRLVHARKGGP
jgi:transposase